MANYTQRRIILSLRQPFHLYHNFNCSISRSVSHKTQLINPNFRSSPFPSTSVLPKLLTFFNSSQSIQSLSFSNSLNGVRSFATRLSESSSSSNRPPKETIMLEGCDFEHWLVVVEPPDPQLTRDDIIDGYIKTLAQILGSEEEARMKIYSVSTRHYFAFSALISEELSYKLKELPNVRWVLPDSYMDVKNKTYAGEPFINGQAVPYDPKYHEIWVRNNEESLRNNNKSRRRQRDPNSRSRSPTSASARSSSNQNWMSASDSQPNQAPRTFSSPNQASHPSSLSGPNSHQQNWTRPTGSLNQVAQSSRTQNPSHMQNQAPATFSQHQAPQPPDMQNNSMPWTPSPPRPPVTTPNTQAWGSHNHSWEPPRGYENQALHPSHMQNQKPSPSFTQNPNDPASNVQSDFWESTTTYQSQPPQPLISNNFQYNNMPPSAPSSNVPYQRQSWVPAPGYQREFPQPPISNITSHANVQPARGTPAHTQNTDFHGGSMPSQARQDGYSYSDISHRSQRGGFSNGYPSQSFQQQQYQASNSAYRDMRSSNFEVTPSTQNSQNSSRWGMPDDIQRNSYSRNVPHHIQNAEAHTGYPSEPPYPSQHQQYQNNSRNHQNPNASASPQSWNYKNMNPSMPNSFSPNMPMSHGMQGHYFQGEDMHRPMQNSEFQHNMGPTVQNVDYNGERMPSDASIEAVQTKDYQERDIPIDNYMYASK